MTSAPCVTRSPTTSSLRRMQHSCSSTTSPLSSPRSARWDHAGGLTVVAVDRNEHALRELPDGVRREVADTTDPSVATPLIDRIAGEVGPLTCW
jgi:hypothetical protein